MKELNRYRWIVVFLCAISSFFLTLVNVSFSPILLIVKTDLDLTYTQSSLLTTSYFMGYMLGQIPWGYITNKLKPTKSIFLSVLGLTLFTFLSSVALTGNLIIITRFFSGFLGAGIWVPGIRLISDYFPMGNRGLAIGLFAAGVSLGGIFVSFTSPYIALTYGWKWTLRIFSALGLVIAILTQLWLKDVDEKEAPVTVLDHLQSIVSQKIFWILGYDQLMRLGLSYTFSTWLPTFLVEQYGFTIGVSSLSLTLINVLGIFSNPLSGYISDRIGALKSVLLAFVMITPSLYVLSLEGSPIFIWVIIGLIGYFVNFLRSPLFAILPDIYGSEHSGVLTGYQNTFASAGAFLLPLSIGFFRDTTKSFEVGWYSLIILCIIALISTMTQLKLKNTR